MKNFFVHSLILATVMLNAQVKKRVLFIGNSYTYVNNLPQLTKDIALSKSDTLVFDQTVIGGATFNTHAGNPTTYSLIQSQNWDVVVIQGQSQEPSLDNATVMANSYPYAKKLADSVRKYHPCCEVLFYMTWGRKNSDTQFCPTYTPSCSYAGMQARLRQNYLMFADSFNSACAPVGVAWKKIRTMYPQVELYDPDESHPSMNGSYLAASVFYASIFQKAVTGATYYATVTPSDAVNFHQVATSTVLDSMSVWNLNSFIPGANFTYQFTSSNTVQFNAASANGTTFNWSFGSGLKNPVTTFSASPPYVVTLTVSNTCTTSVITKTLTSTGLTSNSGCDEPLLNMSPEEIAFLFSCEEFVIRTATIYDLSGRKIKEERFSENKIIINDLPSGIYLLHVTGGRKSFVRKFIK